MKIYRVGGAVRDKLLGLPYTETDWVVEGATPEQMLQLGYQQVGRDFPVFLHPKSKQEYALARTERKSGKGYTGFVGRALTALHALEEVADCLDGYAVLIYSASLQVRLRALVLRLKHRVPVRIIKKRTSHAVMLGDFSKSRVYIGISLSDGISTSLLEAMATGCYPIQTGTSCASEWLTSTSGAIVDPNDINEISHRIREAIKSDILVDKAAIVNVAIIQSRASTQVLSSVALSFYEDLLP